MEKHLLARWASVHQQTPMLVELDYPEHFTRARPHMTLN